MVTVMHRREDGTFVALVNSMPYHILQDDPLFAEAQAAADGIELTPEPVVVVTPPVPTTTQPTPAQLMARLAELQAQIEALT